MNWANRARAFRRKLAQPGRAAGCADQKENFLGAKRADIAPGLRKFHLIGSIGANALWNDDISDEGFATIELPVK